jgi:hypothetical protein
MNEGTNAPDLRSLTQVKPPISDDVLDRSARNVMDRVADKRVGAYPRSVETLRGRFAVRALAVALIAVVGGGAFLVARASTVTDDAELAAGQPAGADAALFERLAAAAATLPAVGTDEVLVTRTEAVGPITRAGIDDGLHAAVETVSEFSISPDGRGRRAELSATIVYGSDENEAAWQAAGGPPATSLAPSAVDLSELYRDLGESRASVREKLLARYGDSVEAPFRLLSDVADLLSVTPYPAEQRQGIFDALGAIGGLTVDEEALDSRGRPGVLVSAINGEGDRRLEIVLDPADSSLLEQSEYNLGGGQPALWSRVVYVARDLRAS